MSPPGNRPENIDYGARHRLGFIVPSGNIIAEPQIRAMLPEGVAPLFTRLALRGSSEEELRKMESGVEAAASLLADAKVESIVFHCTAVTTFAPNSGAKIRQRIEQATNVPGVVTSDAIGASLDALGVKNVALLSPYISEVHERERLFLEGIGKNVVHDAALGIDRNDEMAQLSQSYLFDWVAKHQTPSAEAYFVSCTALRTAEIITSLEERLGRPVITSNQAAAWYACKQVGEKIADVWGRLSTH